MLYKVLNDEMKKNEKISYGIYILKNKKFIQHFIQYYSVLSMKKLLRVRYIARPK